MIDLLLCNPYSLGSDRTQLKNMEIYPLLGQGYLASYLGASGCSVEIFDNTFAPDQNSYREMLANRRPRAIGIYGHMVSRSAAYRFARIASRRGVLTIAGGPDATGYYPDYLKNGFDIVVLREGEETIREVMEWARGGADTSRLGKIPGIAYRADEGKIVLNPDRPYIENLDLLPFPRRDEYIHRPYLLSWQERHGFTSLPILGARGCPFGCAFCYRPVFGRRYRQRSPGNVVAEIEECVRRFNVTHFRFVDDTFVVDSNWVKRISTLVRERDLELSFDVLARPELLTDCLAEDLCGMGVRRLYFGMESGSDRVLQKMNKNLKVEQSYRAAEIAREHGMEFLSWIMLGYDGEEKGDISLTRDMLVDIKPTVTSISIAVALPETEYYRIYHQPQHKRRYPRLFYVFARRWLYEEVKLAANNLGPLSRLKHTMLKWAYWLGKETLSLSNPRSSNGRNI